AEDRKQIIQAVVHFAEQQSLQFLRLLRAPDVKNRADVPNCYTVLEIAFSLGGNPTCDAIL
ncbi:hypothetical protein, partial [Acinetobacter baumannii]|uniref:hypothetical protein n=1 Tax=Acinetobacter baumannii TaxID=470 RepID=UPI001C0A4F12